MYAEEPEKKPINTREKANRYGLTAVEDGSGEGRWPE